MRIGYIGHFGDWHTEWGVSDALEKRAEVDRYCFNGFDRAKFTARDYDMVLTTVPYSQPDSFWKAQKGLKIAHYFDLIVGWQGRENVYFPSLKNFDLVLSTDGSRNRAYKDAGIKRCYFKQAFNPEWYFPAPRRKYQESEVAFIGGAYSPKRRQMIVELGRRYRFKHYGKDNSCRGQDHARAIARTKIMVCDNAVNDLEGYWSNRVYLHLACRGFVLHPRVPGMSEVFTDGEHLIYYDGYEDLFTKIEQYLPLEDERWRIARAGCQSVRKHHTWDARMEEFWQILSDLGLSDIPTAPLASVPSSMTSGSASAPTPFSL